MDTLTAIYIALIVTGGLLYWIYGWVDAKEPFSLRKAAKTWLSTAALSIATYFSAPITAPLTWLTIYSAVSVGVLTAMGVDKMNERVILK